MLNGVRARTSAAAVREDLFRQRVPHALIVEVDANHLTINTHRQTPNVIKRFLDGVLR